MQTEEAIADRFWSKVDKSGDCWEWTAHKAHNGYGVFWLNGKNTKAHRVVMFLEGSDIPSGMMVCHHCDNPGCVNPDHLYIGDHAKNMRDKVERGRLYRGSNHHLTPLTEDDVRQIRRMDGSHQEIAEAFGVTDSTICKIRLRQTWSHVS